MARSQKMATPKIPKTITHKNMKPLLVTLAGEPEFQPGPSPPINPDAWYREIVTLEFPTGEIAVSFLQTLALVGRSRPDVMSLTGKEHFVAQGLEGKVQIQKDLFMALMNLRDLLPEHRGRIIRGKVPR